MAATVFDEESLRFSFISKERLFIAKIRDYQRLVSTLHRDPRVVELVKTMVPWQKLSCSVTEKTLALKSEPSSSSSSTLDARDLFLVELLDWYKNQFFSWFDQPVCKNAICPLNGVQMESVGSGQPSLEDMSWGAARIELYKCASCGNSERFPRYNHPLKLIETRTGRCGEWANVFTCLCSAFGYDSRLVLDWTDHVWSEVWSESQKRWIHMDCCENAIDTPLMYEIGWGKKISYVIAVSPYEIQDVTWRYTQHKPYEILSRRSECQETWLPLFVLRINDSLQKDLPSEKRLLLRQRSLQELVELIWTPWKKRALDTKELQGRQSGSEAWRKARNELGKLSLSNPCHQNHVFQFRDEDFQSGKITLTYNCASDEYQVNDATFEKGWSEGVFEYSNIFRKIEHDWKMVYLSRKEGSPPDSLGTLSWKLDLTHVNWSRVSLFFHGLVLEDAAIDLAIEGPSSGDSPPIKKSFSVNEEVIMQRSHFPGSSSLIIKASLSGKAGGTVAWQKAQLFRQSLVNDRTKKMFVIQVFR